MRRALMFAGPGGTTLAGTIDEANGSTGLLIVTGGTQARIGPHRSQALLAAAVAGAGFPVFRFDRRGVGDSSGDDPGYLGSGPDLASAAAEFQKQSPYVNRIICYGLCDGAAALAAHLEASTVDGLILANPWVVEPGDDLPPPAAIRQRYRQRLFSIEGWRRLLTGRVNVRRLALGLKSVARAEDRTLADRFGAAIGGTRIPVTLLIAKEDATAIAFEAALPRLSALPNVERHVRATGSHSFAGPADRAWLTERVIQALRR